MPKRMPAPSTASRNSPTTSRRQFQPGRAGLANVGRPQAIAVHVLGDEHDVARAGRGEVRRPRVGVPLLEARFPVAGERCVGAVAVHLAVMARDRDCRESAASSRTTRRTARTERVASARLHELADVDVDRRERGHRRRRPVHEDPELRVRPPRRHAVMTQRLERAISHWPGPARRSGRAGPAAAAERLGLDALRELGPVLDAEDNGVDALDAERVSMREQRGVDAELRAQRAERRGPFVVDGVGMAGFDLSVELRRERSRLHRANAHHAHTVCLCRGDDRPRARRLRRTCGCRRANRADWRSPGRHSASRRARAP